MVSKFNYWLVTFVLFVVLLSSSIGISVHTDRFVQPEITSPVSFSLALIFLFVFLVLLSPPKFYIKINVFGVALSFIFICLALVSSVFYSNFVDAIKWVLVQFFTLSAFYLLFLYFSKNKFFVSSWLLALVSWFGVFSFFFAVALYYLGSVNVGFAEISHLPGYSRLYGWYGNPNRFSSVMGCALIASFAMLYNSNKITMKWLPLCLLFFVGVLFGASMATIVALFFSFLLFYLTVEFPRWVSCYRIRKKDCYTFIASLIFLAAVGVLIVVNFDYFNNLLKIDSRDLSATGRTAIWAEGFAVYSQGGFFSLFFGNGFDSFRQQIGVSSHSFYIKHIFENGLFFVVFFVSVNAYFLYHMVRDSRSSNVSLSLGATFAVLIVFFMLIRNLATPSFFQVRPENLFYYMAIINYFLVRKSCFSHARFKNARF